MREREPKRGKGRREKGNGRRETKKGNGRGVGSRRRKNGKGNKGRGSKGRGGKGRANGMEGKEKGGESGTASQNLLHILTEPLDLNKHRIIDTFAELAKCNYSCVSNFVHPWRFHNNIHLGGTDEYKMAAQCNAC